MKVRILAPALITAVVALAACNPTRSATRRGRQQPPETTGPVLADPGADRFGVTGAVGGEGATTLLGDLGVGWIRIPVNWSEIEPRPGQYRWTQVERALRSHERSKPGIRVIVTLRAFNRWAGGPANSKAALPPRNLGAYYDFVYGMAQRGKGVVDCWQIENEEESPSWWAGSAEQYIELLRTAHRAIRAADPGAKVMLGGFTSEFTTLATFLARGAGPDEIARRMGFRGRIQNLQATEAKARARVDFMNTVLAQAKDYVDMVDIHLYNEYETIPARVEWMRERMRAYGYEKPIWCTELGGPDTLVASYSEEANAQEVVKRTALALASGVQKVFWLGLTEMQNQGERFDHLGLVARNGRRKPSFTAYQTTIRELGDLPYVGSVSLPGGHGFRFGRGSRRLWVLWADRGAQFGLEVGGSSARVVHMDGRAESVQTRAGLAQLSLTASPILVEAIPG